MNDQHKCPVNGCKRILPHHILFCLHHWRMVPPALQREVYARWDRGNPASWDAYMRVRQQAIDAVNAEVTP